MQEVSRRGFIVQASAVGAAAAVATVVPLSKQPATATAAAEPVSAAKINGPVPDDMVVHIRDPKTGEVALIAGHEEVVYTDARLVSSVLSKFSSRTKE